MTAILSSIAENLISAWSFTFPVASIRQIHVADGHGCKTELADFLDMMGMLWLQKYRAGLREFSPKIALVLVSHDGDVVNAT